MFIIFYFMIRKLKSILEKIYFMKKYLMLTVIKMIL